MRTHELMSPDVIDISPDTTVAEAKLLLDRHGIHHLVVAEKKKIRGIVSDRDLATAANTVPVREIMTRNVITIEDSATIRHAAAVMDGHGFQSLPVVDEKGKLCGIVTASDILRALAKGSTHPAPAAQRVILRSRGPRRRQIV